MKGARGGLPRQLTSFVGREREVNEVSKALDDAQLLTLTGDGGIGKTRLALRVAGEQTDRFPDGTWWVDLAPLGAGESVADSVAESLEIRPLPGMTSTQALCANLAARRGLLVLDNCEHVLQPSAEVVEQVLGAAPGLTVLATSRAPLGLDAEADWRVPPLSVPDERHDDLETVSASEAGRLFATRAAQADASFELSDENAAPVARICRELEGIPLALELAAARTRVLSAGEIAHALSDRLRLLSGGPRRAASRQQTLRASIDWSHDLLEPRERALFRRIAVFAGGFDLAAAEDVCGGDDLSAGDVLDLLDSLVEKSLVSTEKRGQRVRFKLLETIRQYAIDQLTDSGELDQLRDRHRDYFLSFAETAAPHLGRAGETEWFDRLDAETFNFATAVDHAIGSEPSQAARLGVALWLWRRARRPIGESRSVFARILSVSGSEPPGLRAQLFLARSYSDMGGGEFEAAEEDAAESLALARQAGDTGGAGRALIPIALTQGYWSPAAGRSQLVRAAELAREAEDHWGIVEAAQFIAVTYLFQDLHAEIEAVLAEVDDLTDTNGEGGQLGKRALVKGSTRILDGELERAEEILETALPAIVDADPAIGAWIEAQLGLVEIFRGRPADAVKRLDDLLERTTESGGGVAIPALIIWAAFAELALGRFEGSRNRLAAALPLVEGRDCLLTLWGRWILAEDLRLEGSEDAAEIAGQAVSLGEEVGNRLGAGRARLTLARLAAADGEWGTAEEHALTHLDACAEGGHATFIPSILDALAEIAAGLEDAEKAARLVGAAARGREQLGVARFTAEDQHWEALEGELRATLGGETYDAATRAGHELEIDDAVAWLRRARGTRKRPSGGWEALTPTELKVAELVAEGMTNPAVAEKMFVSRGTVKAHLSHIYRKLDIGGRAELAAAAARRKA